MQVAPEDAIRALQAALPHSHSKPQAPVELENVRPTLLLTPTERGGVASELAGGAFHLGDRVACLKATGKAVNLAALAFTLRFVEHSPALPSCLPNSHR